MQRGRKRVLSNIPACWMENAGSADTTGSAGAGARGIGSTTPGRGCMRIISAGRIRCFLMSGMRESKGRFPVLIAKKKKIGDKRLKSGNKKNKTVINIIYYG